MLVCVHVGGDADIHIQKREHVYSVCGSVKLSERSRQQIRTAGTCSY